MIPQLLKPRIPVSGCDMHVPGCHNILDTQKTDSLCGIKCCQGQRCQPQEMYFSNQNTWIKWIDVRKNRELYLLSFVVGHGLGIENWITALTFSKSFPSIPKTWQFDHYEKSVFFTLIPPLFPWFRNSGDKSSDFHDRVHNSEIGKLHIPGLGVREI